VGKNLFKANISGAIKKAIGPNVLDATLTKVTPGSRTSGSLTGGTNPTSVSYSGKGFVDTYKDGTIDGTIIKEGDKMVVLIGDYFPIAPEANDKITIEGSTHIVVAVGRDPDAATYTCQVR